MKYPLIALILASLSLTACGKSHVSNCSDAYSNFENGPLKQMMIGQTTEEQVVAIMGAPDGHTTSDYSVYEQGADRSSAYYCGVISFTYTSGGDGNPAHDLFSQAFERRSFGK